MYFDSLILLIELLRRSRDALTSAVILFQKKKRSTLPRTENSFVGFLFAPAVSHSCFCLARSEMKRNKWHLPTRGHTANAQKSPFFPRFHKSLLIKHSKEEEENLHRGRRGCLSQNLNFRENFATKTRVRWPFNFRTNNLKFLKNPQNDSTDAHVSHSFSLAIPFSFPWKRQRYTRSTLRSRHNFNLNVRG